MKIKMEVAPGIPEPEIILRCAEAGEAAAGLLSRLYELAAEDTGKLTFLYTAGAVYETELRLYELEERLRGRGFFRASKSALVNFNAIRSLRPDLGGRIRLTMDNGEAVYVSRQYAPWLKKKLGL